MIGAHRDGGGYAEYVTVPARNLVPLPGSISFEEACLIPNAIGPIVKACAGRARIHPGENVLIVGAGGGMGLHAVQMARVCGGRVIREPLRRAAGCRGGDLFDPERADKAGRRKSISSPRGRPGSRSVRGTGNCGAGGVGGLDIFGARSFDYIIHRITNGHLS